MGATNFDTPATWVKIGAQALGTFSLLLGLLTHFVPGFVTKDGRDSNFYTVCDVKDKMPEYFVNKECPPTFFDYFYVSIIIASFVLSGLVMAAGYFVNLRAPPMKYVDLGYYILSALFLVAASGLYVYSTVAIDSFLDGLKNRSDDESEKNSVLFRKWERIGAALLTMLWALCHGIIAELIVKC